MAELLKVLIQEQAEVEKMRADVEKDAELYVQTKMN